MIVAIATFAGVLVLMLGIYWLFVVRPEQQSHSALQERIEQKAPVKPSGDITSITGVSLGRLTTMPNEP